MDDCGYGHTQKLLIKMRGYAGDGSLGSERRLNEFHPVGAQTARGPMILPKQVPMGAHLLSPERDTVTADAGMALLAENGRNKIEESCVEGSRG